MDTNTLIKELKKSGLIAECPCGSAFRLSDAILFDGMGKILNSQSFRHYDINILSNHLLLLC